MTGSFLEEPPVSAQVQALYDEDLTDSGYVWNVSRLWAHQPDTLKQLFGLMSEAFTPSGLTFRQRGILVTAAASALGDSYCSLAWGGKLGEVSDAAVAAGVLNGGDAGLTDQEKAMAAWARKVARDPNATTPADIQALHDTGLDDGQIFAITAFVALRLAFSTINDSLGAQPDTQLAQSLPREVREAVTYGRLTGLLPTRGILAAGAGRRSWPRCRLAAGQFRAALHPGRPRLPPTPRRSRPHRHRIRSRDEETMAYLGGPRTCRSRRRARRPSWPGPVQVDQGAHVTTCGLLM